MTTTLSIKLGNQSLGTYVKSTMLKSCMNGLIVALHSINVDSVWEMFPSQPQTLVSKLFETTLKHRMPKVPEMMPGQISSIKRIWQL